FSLSSWALARYTLVVALTLASLYLLWTIQEVVLLLVLAILLATAIEPLVNGLRHGPFNRSQGIIVVYTAIIAVLALIGLIVVPNLVTQSGQLIEAVPSHLASLRQLAERLEPHALSLVLVRAINDVTPAITRGIQEPTAVAQPEQLKAVGGVFAQSVLSVITVFLLAFYWLTERASIKRAILRLVPSDRARGVNATWLDVEDRLGAWVRGQLLIMLILAGMAGLAFVALGLPNPLLLAALAGLFEIVPMIGPFLAFIPALLVALTADPVKALLLLPIAVVIQQIEGNLLLPRVMSRTVGVSPLTVILGILIGSILHGAAGAFLAVPVAAAIQVILNHTLRPAIEDATETVPVPPTELEGERRPALGITAPSE
ncbi:MAG TPA: AI-2E family transporter, partial [Chloroflexota bacterium]|nr:AI-2E family transporter [Chloroflexota bacterium]